MSVEGSIATTVLFHDRDGTTSLKVVDLSGSQSYGSGKVAIVSGTAGTAAVTVAVAPSSYLNATGTTVSFSSGISRLAFSASSAAKCSTPDGDSKLIMFSRNNSVSVTDTYGTSVSHQFSVQALTGTTTYSIVIYGEE